MTEERGVLRRIAWRELFPWLIIFRTFRLSISPTLLAVATLAVALTYIGWWIGGIFLIEKVGDEWKVVPPPSPQLAAQMPAAVGKYLPRETSSTIEGYFRLADPIYGVFRRDMTLKQAAFYVFVSLWTLAIWAFAGGFITRRAVVEFGLDETPDFMETARFTARRYLWYFLAPLYPLLGIFILSLPIAALGFIAWLHGLGFILAGILWIFVVLAGLVAAWLLGGLVFGWPLMWGTISAEREGDAFEAFSRSFSYVYGKPLHYLFYTVVAALFGALCYAVAHYTADMVIEFGYWAFSWGAGAENAARLQKLSSWDQFGHLQDDDGNGLARIGGILLSLSIGFVRLIETGFIFSFFWCVAGAIYLLMRQDVDDKEMDEVYVSAESTPPQPAPSAPASPSPTPEPGPGPSTEAPPSEQRLIETVQAPPP